MPSDGPNASAVNWDHAVYQLGKLTDVVHALVVGEGDARSRLRDATSHLRALVPGMLPENEGVRLRVERALATLKRYHDPAEYAHRPSSSPETEFDATLNRIRNSTASSIALDLFSAWGSLGDMVDEHFRESFSHNDSSVQPGAIVFVTDGSPQSSEGLPEDAAVIIDDL